MRDTIKKEHVSPDIMKIGKRTWEGVLVDNRISSPGERTVVWRCGHEHSKPEFNVRFDGSGIIWEQSARYCARAARRLMEFDDPDTIPRTDRGLIDHEPHNRLDFKRVIIGSTTYYGVLLLKDDTRRLYVADREVPIFTETSYDGLSGLPWIDLDRPRSNRGTGFTAADYRDAEIRMWLMAAAALREDIWGLTFRHPDEMLTHLMVTQEMIEQFIPENRGKTPYIRAVRQGRKREFEVVDHRGRVVLATPHRGKAARELEKLEPTT